MTKSQSFLVTLFKQTFCFHKWEIKRCVRKHVGIEHRTVKVVHDLLIECPKCGKSAISQEQVI